MQLEDQPILVGFGSILRSVGDGIKNSRLQEFSDEGLDAETEAILRRIGCFPSAIIICVFAEEFRIDPAEEQVVQLAISDEGTLGYPERIVSRLNEVDLGLIFQWTEIGPGVDAPIVRVAVVAGDPHEGTTGENIVDHGDVAENAVGVSGDAGVRGRAGSIRDRQGGRKRSRLETDFDAGMVGIKIAAGPSPDKLILRRYADTGQVVILRAQAVVEEEFTCLDIAIAGQNALEEPEDFLGAGAPRREALVQIDFEKIGDRSKEKIDIGLAEVEYILVDPAAEHFVVGDLSLRVRLVLKNKRIIDANVGAEREEAGDLTVPGVLDRFELGKEFAVVCDLLEMRIGKQGPHAAAGHIHMAGRTFSSLSNRHIGLCGDALRETESQGDSGGRKEAESS